MSSQSHKKIIMLTESLNPLVWARNGAESAKNAIVKTANANVGTGIKNVAKFGGKLAGAFVPNNVKRDFKTIKNGIGYKSKSEREKEAREKRTLEGQKNTKESGNTRREPQVKVDNEHKYINNYLVRNGLRSTKLTGLGSVAAGRSSSRFGIVNNQGKPTLMFYPFTLMNAASTQDNDTGFVLYDAASKKMRVINKPLKDTQYPTQEGFITLENSPSRVPHHTRG